MKILQIMKKHGVNDIVFSSSATVYGAPKYLPIDEKHPIGQGITNPYGQTKSMCEQILRDVALSDKDKLNLPYFFHYKITFNTDYK